MTLTALQIVAIWVDEFSRSYDLLAYPLLFSHTPNEEDDSDQENDVILK
ncbi:26919_t:CDS:2 [Racocetra persica]|uniref:26919_t:CDS:1 n=1 Tax=Racocetra persica TaxID=160502 RepID=A0ACA9RMU9_9GLOM|nr:26919_t:CDS:2 [Racocetra persica]